MQAQSTSTVASRHPQAFWANIEPRTIPASWQLTCPACGRPTEEGLCFNLWCSAGLYNQQVALGQEIPEQWLMLEVGEPVTAGPNSPARVEVAA